MTSPQITSYGTRKYTIQITRWEPFIGDITVEATSRTAAIAVVKQKAKALFHPDDYHLEADTTQTSKISINGVITHD